jgi:hypothetical protein
VPLIAARLKARWRFWRLFERLAFLDPNIVQAKFCAISRPSYPAPAQFALSRFVANGFSELLVKRASGTRTRVQRFPSAPS